VEVEEKVRQGNISAGALSDTPQPRHRPLVSRHRT
jgi:hypothetical protein